MEINAQSTGTNTLILNSKGYSSRNMSFEEFIGALVKDVNKEGLVKGVSFNGNTIRMFLVDEIYGLEHTRDIILDEELINNLDFMRLLREFIAYCDSKKFELFENARKKIITYEKWDSNTINLAEKVFKEYVSTGQILPINSLEAAKKVIVTLRDHNSSLYTEVESISLERYISIDFKKAKPFKYLQNGAKVSSALSFLSFATVGAIIGTPIALAATSGALVASVATSVLSGIAKRKIGTNEAIKAMDELANELEMIYFGDKINQSSLLLESVDQPRRLR